MTTNNHRRFGKFESLEARKLFAADLSFAADAVAPMEVSENSIACHQTFEHSSQQENVDAFVGGIDDFDFKGREGANHLVPTLGAGSGVVDDVFASNDKAETPVGVSSYSVSGVVIQPTANWNPKNTSSAGANQ